jgi:hypothetical protein
MDREVTPQQGRRMLLEPGTTLEEQCNKNYTYLNQQGISMHQFVGVLNGLEARFKEGGAGEAYIQLVSGGWERVIRQATISGQVINPLTGEVQQDTEYVLSVSDQDMEQTNATRFMAMYRGIAEIEIQMAREGIFGAPSTSEPQASCRAEQMLFRLRHTNTGRQLLRDHGIDDPAQRPMQPIALVAIPEGPTPRQQWEAEQAALALGEEQVKLELTTELGDTIKALKAAEAGLFEQQKVYDKQKGGKGQAYHYLLSEVPRSLPQPGRQPITFTEATWVEVTEWPRAPRDFKIIQSQNFGQGYRFGAFSNNTVWAEGEPARSEQPNKDRYKPPESRLLTVEELGALADVVVEPHRDILERWRAAQAARSRRAGRGLLGLKRSD